MQTPAQIKASRESKARRIAAGEKTVTVWLSKYAQERLNKLAKIHGSKQAALEALLQGEAITLAPTPSKPVSEPENGPSVRLKVRPAFNPQPKKGKK
jgi:hypothetical protein